MKKIIILTISFILSIQAVGQDKYNIYHYVPFIPQPDNTSCWSASIAMILWWRDNKDANACLPDALTPEQVRLIATFKYWSNYFSGLPADDIRTLRLFGFETISPQSFTLETFANYLDKSPIWVAWDGCDKPFQCNHAVVIVGLKGDGTANGTSIIYHDPDDGSQVYPNLGERDVKKTYSEFIQRLNRRALSFSSGNIHFIAYLKSKN
ncbi:MAG: papain-like cysteine protease family protein [Saprospiraceae bacterium]